MKGKADNKINIIQQIIGTENDELVRSKDLNTLLKEIKATLLKTPLNDISGSEKLQKFHKKPNQKIYFSNLRQSKINIIYVSKMLLTKMGKIKDEKRLNLLNLLKLEITRQINKDVFNLGQLQAQKIEKMSYQELKQVLKRDFSSEQKRLSSYKLANLITEYKSQYNQLIEEYSFLLENTHLEPEIIKNKLTLKEIELKETLKAYIHLKLITSNLNKIDKELFDQEIDQKIEKYSDYKKNIYSQLKILNTALKKSKKLLIQNLEKLKNNIENKKLKLKQNKLKEKNLENLHEKISLNHQLAKLHLNLKHVEKEIYNIQEIIHSKYDTADPYDNEYMEYSPFEDDKLRIDTEINLEKQKLEFSKIQLRSLRKFTACKIDFYIDLVEFAIEKPFDLLNLIHEINYLTSKSSIKSNPIENTLISSIKRKYQLDKINYNIHLNDYSYSSLVEYIKQGGKINSEIIKIFCKKLNNLKISNHNEDNLYISTVKSLQICAITEPEKTAKTIKVFSPRKIAFLNKAYEFLYKVAEISKSTDFHLNEKSKIELKNSTKEIKDLILRSRLDIHQTNSNSSIKPMLHKAHLKGRSL